MRENLIWFKCKKIISSFFQIKSFIILLKYFQLHESVRDFKTSKQWETETSMYDLKDIFVQFFNNALTLQTLNLPLKLIAEPQYRRSNITNLEFFFISLLRREISGKILMGTKILYITVMNRKFAFNLEDYHLACVRQSLAHLGNTGKFIFKGSEIFSVIV